MSSYYQPINSASEKKKREAKEAKKAKEWQPDKVDPNVDVMLVTRQMSEGVR